MNESPETTQNIVSQADQEIIERFNNILAQNYSVSSHYSVSSPLIQHVSNQIIAEESEEAIESYNMNDVQFTSQIQTPIITETISDKYTRFKDATWFNSIRNTRLTIAGAGGIGSWTALALASAGVEKMLLIDYDNVEESNLAGQFFRTSQIGSPKIDAVRENIHNFTGTIIGVHSLQIDENNGISTAGNLITAFDKIKPRRDAFNHWLNNQCLYTNPENNIYIDGRLTFNQIQIFTIRGNDQNRIEDYLKNQLPDDSTIEELSCTLKQTRFMAMKIAGMISEIFTNHLTNVESGNRHMKVPYFIDYFTPRMTTTILNEPNVE